MTVVPHPSTETALQKERRLFRELYDRLINTLLNSIFDLSPEKAQLRARNLTIMLLVSGFLLTLIYYPLGLWAQHLQEFFLYLLNSDYAASHPTADPTAFFTFAFRAFTDPRVVQYLPIFLAPFFIAQQLAAIYLADIFELEDVAVARRFVSEVALSGSNETIRISEGKVGEKYLASPNYLIGGPGRVMVDLDSVALFERADGTPHVIGPTGKEPGGRATIDGFERFRQAIDIRDQHVDLSVTSRSRDGIPITATDVRLMFSIDRGENLQLSAEYPYPFEESAIRTIVYRSSSRVTPDKAYPSNYEFSWLNNMSGLIRGRLGGFMSERNLTEYLANIGVPEIEKSKQREELIAEQVRRLTQPPEDGNDKPPKAPPTFTPRHQITNLFSQFAEEFTKSARNSGVILHWIGVGTWKTALEIDVVSEKHLEAWKLSQDNMRTGNPEAMRKAESESTLQKMATLIRSVPIDAYYDLIGFKRPFNKKSSKKQDNKKQDTKWFDDRGEDMHFDEQDIIELFSGQNLMLGDISKRINEKVDAAVEHQLKGIEKETDRRVEMRALLLEYRNQLSEAVQFMSAKNEPVPESIREAIKYINDQMGFRHWAGRP